MVALVLSSKIREYGRAKLDFVSNSVLMKDVVKNSQVWMSHGDTISTISNNFNILASTKDVKIAGFSLNMKIHMACSFIRRFFLFS